MRVYRVVKELVFWLSVLGFLFFACWVYSIQDKFTTVSITYLNGSTFQGSCDYVRDAFESERNQSVVAECRRLCDWERNKSAVGAEVNPLVFENITNIVVEYPK